MQELFSLASADGAMGDTETGAIFSSNGVEKRLVNRFDSLLRSRQERKERGERKRRNEGEGPSLDIASDDEGLDVKALIRESRQHSVFPEIRKAKREEAEERGGKCLSVEAEESKEKRKERKKKSKRRRESCSDAEEEERKERKKKSKIRRESVSDEGEDKKAKEESSFALSEKKRERLRALAKRLSQQLSAGPSRQVPSCSEEPRRKEKKKKKRHHEERESRSRRREKGARIDGVRIAGLDKRAIYDHGEEEAGSTDRYIVSSLVKQEAPWEADPLARKEADRVASEARRDLDHSVRACQKAPIGVPTWTGQFGSAGRSRLAKQHREAEQRLQKERKAEKEAKKAAKKENSVKKEFESLFGETLDIRSATKVKRPPVNTLTNALSRAGVETAIDHGAIIDNDTTDIGLLDAEAERLANAASAWLERRLHLMRSGEAEANGQPRFGRVRQVRLLPPGEWSTATPEVSAQLPVFRVAYFQF